MITAPSRKQPHWCGSHPPWPINNSLLAQGITSRADKVIQCGSPPPTGADRTPPKTLRFLPIDSTSSWSGGSCGKLCFEPTAGVVPRCSMPSRGGCSPCSPFGLRVGPLPALRAALDRISAPRPCCKRRGEGRHASLTPLALRAGSNKGRGFGRRPL